jgi:hypothetical protein
MVFGFRLRASLDGFLRLAPIIREPIGQLQL